MATMTCFGSIVFLGVLTLTQGSSLLESFQRGLGLDDVNGASSFLFEGRKLESDGRFETSQPLLADTFGGEPGFYHSVASGDPLADAVVIWYAIRMERKSWILM